MEQCEKVCRWDYVDRNQAVIHCLECKKREVLKPTVKNQILGELAKAGKWAGPDLGLASAAPSSPQEQLPAVQQARTPHVMPQSDLTTYESFDGQRVELSVKIFTQMLCKDANEMQAKYALGWCSHNRIDPYAMEAYFSIMDNKLVIQVSKDAWFKRVENNRRFSHHDGGIIVETALQTIKESILGGMEDHLIGQPLKDRLLADFAEGKALEPKGIGARIRCRKRGIFLDKGEELVGGWAEVHVKDRPHPYRFEIDKEGWQTTKREGGDNIFWSRKGPFMAYKSALKNCCRLAFPDLSGLMNQPEQPEDFDAAGAADLELAQRSRMQKKLFAVGREVAAPLGPLEYEQLHKLAAENFDGKGISELSPNEMTAFVNVIERAAQGEKEAYGMIEKDLHPEGYAHGSIEETARGIGANAGIEDGEFLPVA